MRRRQQLAYVGESLDNRRHRPPVDSTIVRANRWWPRRGQLVEGVDAWRRRLGRPSATAAWQPMACGNGPMLTTGSDSGQDRGRSSRRGTGQLRESVRRGMSAILDRLPISSARDPRDRVAARGLAAHRHRGRRKAAGGRPAVGRGRAYRPTSHDAASRRRLTDAGGPGLIGPGPPVCPAAAGALADPAGTPADDQELGRLPWLALLFLRAFFLRAFFAMLCLLVLVTIRPRASAARSRTGPTALRGPTR